MNYKKFNININILLKVIIIIVFIFFLHYIYNTLINPNENFQGNRRLQNKNNKKDKKDKKDDENIINQEYLLLQSSENTDMKNILNIAIGPNKLIYSEKSPYQNIEVVKFDKNNYNVDKCLLLDNEIQLCDNDEEIYYHEFITHLPAAYLQKLKNVLIIGGGDGMALREIMKYNSIKNVYMLELDKKVLDVSKKYFNVDDFKNDNRVQIIYGDASKTINNLENEYFDLVIIDTTEENKNNLPIDTKQFLNNCKKKMRKKSVLIKNGLDALNIKNLSQIFKYVDFFTINLIAFGDYSFILGSDFFDFKNDMLLNNATKDLYESKLLKKYDIYKHFNYFQ